LYRDINGIAINEVDYDEIVVMYVPDEMLKPRETEDI